MKQKVIYQDGKVWQLVFPLPKNMIKFIIKNASGGVMRKLYKTCKYFYKKAPYCIVDKINLNSFKQKRLEFENDIIDVYGENDIYKFENFWPIQEIKINAYDSYYYLLPQIVRCEARKINIKNNKLTFDEYKILTKSGKVEELLLNDAKITYSDESKVALEDLLKFVPAAFRIKIWNCHTTPQTMEKLLKIQWKQKLNEFQLFIIHHPLDDELFCQFIKKNVGENTKVLCPSNDGWYGFYTFEKLKNTKPLKFESMESLKIECNEPPNKKIKMNVCANETKASNQKGLPQPLINYIIKTANANVMKQFHFCCKYFLKKAPYIFIDYFNDNNLGLRYEEFKIEEFKGKNCWVDGQIRLESIQEEKFNLLISKIVKCDSIRVCCEISDTKFYLLAKLEGLRMLYVKKIINEKRNVISLESILTLLTNLEKIHINGCHITSETLNKLIALPWKNKIKKLYLVSIDDDFDDELFYNFLQKALAPKAIVLLHFIDFENYDRSDFNYNMEKEMKTWKPKMERPSFRVITHEEAQSLV